VEVALPYHVPAREIAALLEPYAAAAR